MEISVTKDFDLRTSAELPCLLCGSTLTRERHHGDRAIFFYGCPQCDSRYYASTLFVQTWHLKDEREKSRIHERVKNENAKDKTPNLSDL